MVYGQCVEQAWVGEKYSWEVYVTKIIYSDLWNKKMARE